MCQKTDALSAMRRVGEARVGGWMQRWLSQEINKLSHMGIFRRLNADNRSVLVTHMVVGWTKLAHEGHFVDFL